MSYKQYKAEQKLLRNTVLEIKTRSETESESELNTELSLKRLLCTEKRIKATLAFLKETKVATRKWILEKEERENEEIKWENINKECQRLDSESYMSISLSIILR